MKHNNLYLEFLYRKYGSSVVNSIMEISSDNSLKLKQGDFSKIYFNNKFQKEIKTTITQLLSEKIDSFIADDYGEWALDFPGWLGELTFDNSGSNKEIMVIGMEPHIENRDFQVCYGLRDINDKSDLLGGNNKNLYQNIIDVFGEYKELADLSKVDNYIELLNKVYISDLCHFAIKGKAKDIFRIKNWRKIRNKIANDLLQREITLIKPKYILSQGTEVSNFIEKVYFRNSKVEFIEELTPNEFNLSLARYKNFPRLTKYRNNEHEVVHVKLPHAASGLTQGFWLNSRIEERKERLDIIKDYIKNF